MAREDIIRMNREELKRLHVIHKVIEGRLKQVEATRILGLCDRQIRRIVKRIKEEGDEGIIHKSRGKASNRAFSGDFKEKVINIYRDRYYDFGPTLANEKLFELDKIKIGIQTLRNWLIEEGEWQVTHKKRKHRQWRERKHYYGEMEQVDGSHHDWFEGRGPNRVLMAYIDDAKSRVFARFYEYEGTFPFMDSFKRYIRKYGLPHSIYIDRHSTYKSTKKPSIEDELNNREPLSEVGRALKELGVEVIYARSAPAKGRIERLFKTFQDRVVKEMRLKGIKSIREANEFLEYYLPIYNKRFSVKALKKGDIHRPVLQGTDVDAILCIKTERTLRNDFTVAHNKKFYQILDHINAKKVIVEERMNGRIFISYKQRQLNYKEIDKRSKKRPKQSITETPKKRYIPPVDHPWRKFKMGNYPQTYTYQQKEKRNKKEKELLLTKT